MAHDPLFENRIADVLTAQGVQADPVKMFGGMAFMVRGNMCVGITNKGDFMVRFNAERHAEVSEWPGAKPTTMGKGDTKGFLFVDAEAVGNKKSLEGEAFAGACAYAAAQGEEGESANERSKAEVSATGFVLVGRFKSL